MDGRCVEFRDPEEFMARAMPLLMADEARNNLPLGIGSTLISTPDHYPEFRLWVVDAGGAPAAAALITPPANLVLAHAVDMDAVGSIVAALAGGGITLPGVAGTRPTVDHFAGAWARTTGTTASITLDEGLFTCEVVESVPLPPGETRPGVPGDFDVVVRWLEAFLAEALPDEPVNGARLRRLTEKRLAGGRSGYWLWENRGDLVCIAGYGGTTPNGVRIGPVYTPPELRGRGYATGLVAELTRWLIAGGRSFCSLYTDLANPTSNAIYRRMGYHQIAEAANYRFGADT